MTDRRAGRAATIAGIACAGLVLGISVLWFAGQESVNTGALAGRSPSRIYPSTWPPAARGALWLVAGAAAVAFDLLVVRRMAETDRGRDFAAAFAVVTGLAFLAVAVASFVDADWGIVSAWGLW